MKVKTTELSVIHPDAQIGKNVHISPFVVIDKDVVIGDNCWIGPHVTILPHCRIGDNCKIFPGAVLGGDPQDLKFEGEDSILEIGNNVTIREYCTLNRGTRANYRTYVGDDSLIMAYVHIAHDCEVGKNCVLANNVTLGGHIEIGDYAIVGGVTAVHQFVRIGSHSIVSGGSLVGKDVPPFVKAARNPLSFSGINSIGLKRRGFTPEQIHQIQDIYRLVFVKNHNIQNSIKEIESNIEVTKERTIVVDFLNSSERGIMKGLRSNNTENGFHS